MRRLRVTVRGTVQGVSYRASAAAAGRRLGVTGWVRNQPDRSVLLEAQGAAAAVDALVEWCHHGPPAAEVTSVEVLAVPTLPDERGFEIRW